MQKMKTSAVTQESECRRSPVQHVSVHRGKRRTGSRVHPTQHVITKINNPTTSRLQLKIPLEDDQTAELVSPSLRSQPSLSGLKKVCVRSLPSSSGILKGSFLMLS